LQPHDAQTGPHDVSDKPPPGDGSR